jgi:hypothetical protein
MARSCHRLAPSGKWLPCLQPRPNALSRPRCMVPLYFQ